MSLAPAFADLLASATVEDSVFELRPDYRALLLVAEGIEPGPSDSASEQLLQEAENSARLALAEQSVGELPHIAAWQEAFRAFGAKPKKVRNSAEALIRRAEKRLPRVNRLTDIYNALSVIHQIPLGGEDLAVYQGAPRLLRATGEEPFETVASGEPTVDHPKPGEVIWCDEAGVTCRRWNWRQGTRTQLTGETASALFIFDALAPLSTEEVRTAADELVEQLAVFSPGLRTQRRLLTHDDAGAGK